MDEFKLKFINLVKKQGSSLESNENEEGWDEASIRHCTIGRAKEYDDSDNLIEDEQVLIDLPSIYYECASDQEVCHLILKDLPERLDCSHFKLQLKTLYRQLNAVSKKTLRLISEKESQCKDELSRIESLENQLEDVLMLCRSSRGQLSAAKQFFTVTGLSVLKHYKKKQVTRQVVSVLTSIRTLLRSDVKIKELLEIGDYPGAISLLLECQKVASSMKQFKCVAQFSAKLQNILETTETQLDSILSKMCKHFDDQIYTKLQEAYGKLDKSHTVIDQLMMHFTSEVHNLTFHIVSKYCSTTGSKQFPQMCKQIPTESIVPCFRALCRECWFILQSFYGVSQWHQRANKNKSSSIDLSGRDFERSLNKQYAKNKLEYGQVRLWNDVQSRASTFIMNQNFCKSNFEDLIHILGILNRLQEIGEAFSGSKTDELAQCMRQQTMNYFQNYHARKLEELRIFLENEIWTSCPVRQQFNLLYLQEFKCLRGAIENHRKPKKADNDQGTASNFSTTNSSSHTDVFARFGETEETPFDNCLDETLDDEVLENLGEGLSGYYSISSEDSDSEELKKASLDEIDISKEKARRQKCNSLLVTNTSLTVLRHCGRYLQMCRLLKPISFDVIFFMCQLFDYYLYNVFHFFTSDLSIQSPAMISFKLQISLKRIEETLIDNIDLEKSEISNKNKIAPSCISEAVQLSSSNNLYGLSERIVAIESLVFLGSQFEYIQPYIYHLIPSEKRHFIEQFYTQTVACAKDVRRVAYMCVSSRVIDMNQVVKEISKVNFNVNDIPCQHSAYIDKIVRSMQLFSMNLNELEIDIPQEALIVLWDNVLHIVKNALVEGFATAKKCSTGGRGLMKLDYTQFLIKAEKLTPCKIKSDEDYVNAYVKAYYYSENELGHWIAQHREYTQKQLESLIKCVPHISKDAKQRFLHLIEKYT